MNFSVGSGNYDKNVEYLRFLYYSCYRINNNKTGTSKVGAISKAQKAQTF